VNSNYIDYCLDPRITIHIAYPDADPQVFGPQYPVTYIIIPTGTDIVTSYPEVEYRNVYDDIFDLLVQAFKYLKALPIRMFNKILR